MTGAEAENRPPPKTPASREQHIQEQLDQALADSSPASDPVSIVTSKDEEDWGPEDPPERPGGTAPPRK
jgi:hypothetical protein